VETLERAGIARLPMKSRRNAGPGTPAETALAGGPGFGLFPAKSIRRAGPVPWAPAFTQAYPSARKAGSTSQVARPRAEPRGRKNFTFID